MHDIYNGPGVVPAWLVYIERTRGSFGWVSVNFPNWAFDLIGVATGLAILLALRAALRYRAAIRARAGELLVLALAFASVALLAHLAFVHTDRAGFVSEQGRYLFPATATVAVGAIGACYGLGRRLAPVGATALVGAIMLSGALSQLLVLVSYYT
jgi:hypothetical protein